MANFSTAWKAFWSILTNDDKAKAWQSLGEKPTLPQPPVPPPVQPEAEPPRAPRATVPASSCEGALHLLSILQREARLVDYLQEDLDAYDDATVGSVSRKIHDDTRRAVEKHFHIVPVLNQPEQSQVDIPQGYDPRQIRLTGKVADTVPASGTLQHKGWKSDHQDFPTRNDAQDPSVICPAEVEI